MVPHSQEPDRTSRFDERFPGLWPEYNRHGDVLGPLWGGLYETFAEFQFVLVHDRSGEMLARGNTIPLVWDENPDNLPSGIDDLVRRAFAGWPQPPNALSAIAAEVPPENRSKGLGALLLKAMAALATERGFRNLLAPVRPNLKERYPLTPIDEYVHWKAADGLPFDPWMRIHVALGAKVLKPAPRSLQITATVAEWENWTGMAFPATGTYVFPHGLSTLQIDREHDVGSYWEPNVWMLHPVPAKGAPKGPGSAPGRW